MKGKGREEEKHGCWLGPGLGRKQEVVRGSIGRWVQEVLNLRFVRAGVDGQEPADWPRQAIAESARFGAASRSGATYY